MATKNKDLVTIALVAMGETSLLTGGARVVQGGTVDVSKADADAAVKSGRWAYLKAEKPSNDGGDKGA